MIDEPNKDKKSAKATAVIVIDMLNEYLDPSGKVYCETCKSIIPALNRAILFANKAGAHVIFVNTELSSERSPLAQKWGLHAEKGKWGSRTYRTLEQPLGAVVIPKTGYNGFYQTELDQYLRQNHINSVAICGIHTHVCVLLTATAAFEHGYSVDVLTDCVTTGYKPNHDTRIRFFTTHVGRAITSEEWMNELSSS